MKRLRLFQGLKEALQSAVGFDQHASTGGHSWPVAFDWSRQVKPRLPGKRPTRRFYRPAVEGLEQRQLLAYGISLFDINTTVGTPLYDASIVHDGKLYFADATPSSGSELFAVDLSTNQKSLVADINPGFRDSSPDQYGFASVGTKLYFTATDDTHGAELRWIDTSAEIPTVNTIELDAGSSSSNAGQYGGFTAVGTKLYFSATDADNGTELRWIDTSAANPTVHTIDINAGSSSSSAGFDGGFTAVGTKLYFTATDDTYGTELRWIDTSVANPTVNTIDIVGGTGSSDAGYHGGFTAVGTKLYFTAYDATNGNELRWIDTSAATPTVNTIDINAGSSWSGAGRYSGFTVVGTKLYFTAYDASNGDELRWIDTSLESPTVNTIDIRSGASNSNAGLYGGFTLVGTKLYFSADDADNGYELRWIDTSVANPTVHTIDIRSGTYGSYAGQYGGFTAVGTKLYFSAYDASNGYELRWIDTSIETPTANTIDIRGGSSSSYAGEYGGFTAVGNHLYFTANDGSGYGLRWLDASAENPTVNTIDIRGGTGNSNAGVYGGFTAVGSKLYFSAYDADNGYELRWIDTSAATPTVNTIDIWSGTGSSNAGQYSGFTAVGSKLYFSAYDADNGTELRWIDTSVANPTVHTIDISAGRNSSVAGQYGGFTVVGTKIYFSAYDASGTELRWIDTSAATPTVHTIDIYAGSSSSRAGYYGGFTVVGSKLYFSAYDADNGTELRWIDTSVDTPTVNTIDLSAGRSSSNAGRFGGFTAVGTKLYFTAADDTHGAELRWIDTSIATPTVNTIDIYSGTDSSNAGEYGGFTTIGTKLYFTAADDTNGTELRWIDTSAATPTVNTIDITAGSGSSNAGEYGGFTSVGTKLYFSATDADNGAELRWIDTSLESPTVNTIDIRSGASNSNAGEYGGFTSVGTKLYFTATDDTYGTEPRWIDTSVANPTVNTIDIRGGSSSSVAGQYGGFTVVGTKLYFSARTATFGYELFEVITSSAPTNIILSNSSIAENSPAPTRVGILSTLQSGSEEFTYALVSGDGSTDNALFDIDGNQLIARSSFDYETASTKSVRVRVTDLDDQSFEKAFTITVTDVPYDISVFDINKTIGTTPLYGESIVHEGKLYFADATSSSGSELFAVDLSTNQKSLVAEIYPGFRDSSPGQYGFASIGTKLYFTATDDTNGTELRWIDTSARTPTVNTIDIRAGSSSSSAGYHGGFTAVGTKLYFSANDADNGLELRWIDTETAPSTVHTIDIRAGSSGSSAGSYGGFKAVGTKLYFTAYDASNGYELRWIDTSEETPTVNTIDIYAGNGSSFAGQYGGFTVVGSKLYFSAHDGSNGRELRWIDTSVDTSTVNTVDIWSGTGSSSAGFYGGFTAVGTKLYFSAQDPDNGAEFRWIDTSEETPTVKTIDIYTGGGYHSTAGEYGGFTSVGTKLYFSATDADNGAELRWIDTSLESPTVNTIDIRSGASNSNAGFYGGFTTVGNKLYFSAYDASNGYELRWIETESAPSTVNTIDIRGGSSSSVAGQYGGFTAVGNHLYFIADDGSGHELRWLDASAASPTVNTVDIWSGSGDSNAGAYGVTAVGTKLYFTATDADNGNELRWIDTSLESPTVHTIVINAGSGGSGAGYYGGFTAVGTKLYFTAYDASNGYELRWIDTSVANPTVHTIDISAGRSSSVAGRYGGFTSVGSKLYFIATDVYNGYELRWIDTSEETPTVNTIDITAGSGSSNAGEYGGFTAVGTKLYFSATDADNGTELRWIDTESAPSTVNIIDIYGGSSHSYAGRYGGFTAVGTKLYFSATDADNGTELRWIDTSVANPTVHTIDIYAGSSSSTAGQFGFAAVGTKLYFNASDAANGRELRWIDTALTTPVVNTIDIWSGSGASQSNAGYYGGFTAVGTKLYFYARARSSDYELHWIDASLESPTVNTIDIYAGIYGSEPGRYGGFTVGGTKLYFSAQDFENGIEPRWIETASAPSTVNTIDIYFGSGSSFAGQNGGFTAVGNKLYFSAKSSTVGLELFELITASAPANILLSNSTIAENSPASTLVGTLSTPQDGSEEFTYALVSGEGSTDNAQFDIVNGNQLIALSSFDYETTTTKSVRVQVTDQNDQTFEKALTITVTDVDEFSNFLLTGNTLREELPVGSTVGSFSSIGDETDETTFVLTSTNSDNAAFAIEGNTLKSAAILDAEQKAYYQIEVEATASGITITRQFTVLLSPLNEFAPVLTSESSLNVFEDTSSVAGVTFSDPDFVPTDPTISISGDDAALFAVVDNEIRFIAPPDFENPLDANEDNTYAFVLTLTEGSLSNSYDYTISVENINDPPTNPTLTSEDYPSLIFPEMVLAGTTIGLFSATDADGPDVPAFRFVDGAGASDNSGFEIVGNELRTTRLFDYEDEADRGLTIRVVAFDVNEATSAPVIFTLGVSDSSEAPTAVSAEYSLDVNGSLPVTLDAQGSGGELTYQITQQPGQGTLSGTLPNLIYTPNTNYIGDDAFLFRAIENGVASFEARISLTVQGVRPRVTIEHTDPVNEDVGTVPVELRLSEPSNLDLWIELSTLPEGTATAGSDYALVGASVFVPAGTTTITTPLTIFDDNADEQNETVVVSIAASPLYETEIDPSVSLTIVDNDDAPTISLVSNNLIVNESSQTIRALLSLSGASHNPIEIPYSLSGSAVGSGQDYGAPSPAEKVVFAAGSTEAWVQIPIIDDNDPESTESITINFGEPSYGSYADGEGTLTFNAFLRDNDLPTISMASSFLTVDESVGTVTVTAVIDAASETAIVVPVIFSGSAVIGGTDADYTTQLPAAFVFQPGATTAHVDLTILDDANIELVPESVVLTLGESSDDTFTLGSQRSTSVTIGDNDLARLEFKVSRKTVWEDVDSFTLTAELDRAVPTAINVPLVWTTSGRNIAIPGADYSLSSSQLYFAPNQTSASVTVTIVNDSRNESTETFRIGFRRPNEGVPYVLGSKRSVLVTIRDNNPILRVASVNGKVSESSNSTARFRFTLSAATNQDVTIPVKYSGTARAGKDYQAASSNTVTIPAGRTSAIVSLSILADDVDEFNESITARVGDVTGASVDREARSATVSILDNDRTTVSFSTRNKSVSEASIGNRFFRMNRIQTVTVKLSGPVSRDTEVSFNFSGKAKRNVDYKVLGLTKGRLLIKAGETKGSIKLEIINDSRYEGNEAIKISITGVTSPVIKPRKNPAVTITIVDNEKPPAPPKPKKRSKYISKSTPAKPAGTLAIGQDPSVGSYSVSSTGGVTPDNSPSGTFSVGSLAILSANQGALLGSTAFFDANFNGVIDFIEVAGDDGVEELAEPSVETQLDGSFSLVIDEFDLDSSGAVETSEGRIALTGGVDISTDLPLRVPLSAPVGIFNITPASTLAESLVRTQGFTVQDALTRVAEALQVPNYDFTTGNAMYQTLENDVLASRTYNSMVQLYSSVINVSQYLAGVSGRELLPTAQAVMDVVGDLIATDGAILNLSSEETIGSILSSAAGALLIEVDPNHPAVVSEVVAAGTGQLAALAITEEVDGEEFLQQLYKVKKVVQGGMADAMFDYGEGSLIDEQLRTDYTGEGLASKISASEVSVTVPPAIGINSLGLVESNSGTSLMRFSVSMVGNHDYPVSVDYASDDDTAVAGVDYTAVTGTLEWAAGDSSERYIDVPITGDELFEEDESFSILLSNGNGLVIREAVGTGFILNDDSLTLTNESTDPTTEVYVELSDESLEIIENGTTTLVSGEFASGTNITYVGSETSSLRVVLDAGSNSFRNDQFSFAGSDAESPSDQLSVIGGDFGAIEYTIVNAQQQYVRLFSSDLTTHVDVTLEDFELAALPVSSVDTVVVRVPSSFGSVTFAQQAPEDANGLEDQLMLVHPTGSDLPGFTFQRPTTKLLVLGIGGEVTANGDDLGVDVESGLAGIYLPTTAIDENLSDVNLGALQSKEIGFDASVTLELRESESNQGDFTIINTNELRADGLIDYETTPVLSQSVRMTNAQEEILDWQVTVIVNDLDDQGPTDIALSSTSIIENQASGSSVGEFSTTDADSGDSFTYTFVSGEGDDDNASFAISESSLITNESFDFEGKQSYSIRVRSEDASGLSFEKTFTISVLDVPELIGDPTFGDGTAQRSLIKQIVLTFDEEVTFEEGAISLIRRGSDGGAVTVAVGGPTDTEAGTQYQLTFSGTHTRGSFNALVDGYYELTIDGSKIIRGGRQLDANADGQLGDVITLGDEEADNYFARYGDVNGDGVIGIADFVRFRRAYGKSVGDQGYNEIVDYGGDGAIGIQDFLQFRTRYGKRKMDF